MQVSASWASASISASYVPNLYPQVAQVTVPSASWVSASAHIVNADTASYVASASYYPVAVASASYLKTLGSEVRVDVNGVNVGAVEVQIGSGGNISRKTVPMVFSLVAEPQTISHSKLLIMMC